MATLLGEARIRIRPDTDGFERETKSSLLGVAGKIAPAIGGALAAVGVGAFFKDAITGASNLNETVSKSNNIFGANAAAVEKWASGAAKNLGLSKSAALESAAGFGNMFQQLGFAGDVATSMSTDVVKLSADLGSFNNLPTADVADRISVAMRGEYDSLQTLIPNINAARVETEAMAMTGKTSAAQLTAQEKAAATLAIVTKDGAAANNDFAETSGGLANKSKIAAAQFEDLQAKVGQKLLPVMTQLMTWVSEKGLPAFDSLSETLSTRLAPAFDAIVGGAQALFAFYSENSGVINAIAVGIGAVVTALYAYRAVVAVVTAVQAAMNVVMAANPFGLIALAVVGVVAALTYLWKTNDGFREAVIGAWTAIRGGVGGVLSWFTDTLWPGIQAVWDGIVSGVAGVLSWVSANWPLILSIVAGPLGAVAAYVITHWDQVKAVFAAGWAWIVDNVWTPVQTFLTVTIPSWWNAYRDLVGAVWTAVGATLQAGWNWVVQNVGVPIATFLLTTVPGYFTTARDTVTRLWNGVGSALRAGWDWVVNNVWTPLATTVTQTLPGYFTTAVNAIGAVWGSLKDKVSGPISTMKSWINDNLIAPLNTVTKLFGLTIPALAGGGSAQPAGNRSTSIDRRAEGGMIHGPGTGTSDSIWGLDRFDVPTAKVSAGEYVVKRSAVAKYGTGFLDAVNVGRFAGGGLVDKAGGWLTSGAKFASDKILGEGADLIGRAVPSPDFANRAAVGAVNQLRDLVGKRAKDYDDTVGSMVGDAFNAGGKTTPNGVGGLGPAAAAARAYVMKTFGLTNIGGYARRNIAGTGKVSDHALGKAIDVMIPNYKSPAGITAGNQVASYFTANPGAFGTKYVIWRDQINSGGGWRAYKHPGGGGGDTLQHRDHVHVSVFDKGGLMNGAGINLSGRPERVLSPEQTEAFERAMSGGFGGGATEELRTLRQELLMRPQVVQYVTNPIAERASQTAQREAVRSALLT